MLVTRRAAISTFIAGGVGSLTGIGAYGMAYSRHQTQVVRALVQVSGLPPALDGLRVGLITDLHHSETVPIEDVSHAADLLMNEKPDLIVMGGDYVTWGDRRYVQPCADALSRLHAPHGVFGALGNHDDDRDMPAALEARGFDMLKDARTRITIRGEPLDIAGIRFWTRRPADIARVLKGATAPVFLIAHDPRRLTQAAALDVSFVLSGHTHGGQVVLPVAGAIAGRRFPLLAGFGREDNTSIFVSRGVGTVYLPYRLNCPPDVSVLTLRQTSDI